MNSTSPALRVKILPAIVAGGLIAGSVDLTLAFLSFGSRMPQGIAAGLLGPRTAFQGGAATWILGVLLHYFIAFAAASVYCLASLRLTFLEEHYLVCGLFYGMGLYLVMNLIVLPISAIHAMGPYPYRDLVQGLLVHMILIGVPIAFCLRRFSQ